MLLTTISVADWTNEWRFRRSSGFGSAKRRMAPFIVHTHESRARAHTTCGNAAVPLREWRVIRAHSARGLCQAIDEVVADTGTLLWRMFLD